MQTMRMRFAVVVAMMAAATGCQEETSTDGAPTVVEFAYQGAESRGRTAATGSTPVEGPTNVPARALFGVAFSESVHSADETSAIALSMRDERAGRTWSVQVDRVVFANAHEMFTGSVSNSGHRQVMPRVPLACGAQYTLTVRGGAYQDVPTNADGAIQTVPETPFRFRTRDNTWTTIDDRPSISGGLNFDRSRVASNPSVASIGTRLYAAWIENRAATGVNQLRVAVRDSASASPAWQFIEGKPAPDQGLNRDPARAAEAPRLHAVGDTLYAAWIEQTAGASQVRVAMLGTADASPAWTYIDQLYDGVAIRASTLNDGLNMDPNRSAVAPADVAPAFAGDGTNLWLAWAESDGTVAKIRAARMVSVSQPGGPTPAWSLIDGGGAAGLNVDPARDAESPSLLAADGKLYLAWAERHGATPGTTTSSRIRVAVSANPTAATPTWAPITSDTDLVNASATGFAYSPILARTGQVLHVAWMESGTSTVGYDMHVKSRDLAATSPRWAASGDDGRSALTSGTTGGVDPNLVVANGELYAAWSERENTGTAYRVRVNRLISDANGRNWVSDDGVLGTDSSTTFGLNRSAGQTGRMPKLVVVPRSTKKTPFTPGVHSYQSLAWEQSPVDRIAAVWSEGTLIRAAEAQGCD